MFKAFLYATYCRMTASTLWDGKGVVNGGYIDVSKTGKITCHYALESDEFKDYLYNLAYLDFPAQIQTMVTMGMCIKSMMTISLI